MAHGLEGPFDPLARVADRRRAGPRLQPILALLVEAHPALQAAFETVLAEAVLVDVVGTVTTVAAATAALATTTTAGSAVWSASSVEVVVASEHLPDGPGTALCATGPAVVITSSHPSDAGIAAAFQAGVRGFVATASPVERLRDAVEAVGCGGTYVDPAVAGRLLAQLGWPGPLGLTGQELRVARLLPRGLTNREIAAELGLSPETVKSHLRRALPKLGAADRVEAAEIVLREGLV